MHRLLLVMLVTFVGNAQGGLITSGYFSWAGHGFNANFSGPGFSATINDFDYDDYAYGTAGFVPYVPPTLDYTGFPAGGLPSTGYGSGVTYNGVSYSWPSGFFPLPATYAGPLEVGLSLISPQPTITGTGVYPVTYSVQINFCLNNQPGGPFYCESDTGIATGAWNATTDPTVTSWVRTNGLTLNIVPEPSTAVLVFAGIVLGCLRRRY